MSLKESVRKEVREIGLVSLFFLACFSTLILLKTLLLEEYHVEFRGLRTAVIGALVVAKVVVLLGNTSFGGRFRSGLVAVHVLWRSLLYTAAVFLVTLAERLFDLYRESGGLQLALDRLWMGREYSHFLAMNLCVGLSLLLYNALDQIDRRLGEGGLRKLFFSRGPGDPAPGRPHP